MTPLLDSHMFNLSALHQILDPPKLVERIRLGKFKMVLHLIPSAEQHEFLILPFLVNPPSASVREGRRIRPKMRCPVLEHNIEFILIISRDKIPAYSNDGCIQRDRRGSRLNIISQAQTRYCTFPSTLTSISK